MSGAVGGQKAALSSSVGFVDQKYAVPDKGRCILWLRRLTDGALVSHVFSVTPEDVRSGRIYDYTLACWGSMRDYQNLEFHMVQAVSQVDRPLVIMRSLSDYVEMKFRDTDGAA
jgi:hypothetical protein